MGLQAGADDYITKPFDRGELLARVQLGMRLVALQQNLAERMQEKARFDMLTQLTIALTHHIRNALTPLLSTLATLAGSGTGQFTSVRNSLLNKKIELRNVCY